MDNRSEPLLKIVRCYKPKELTGLCQNGKGYGQVMVKCLLDADIRGCFDNISHQWLLDNIPMDKKVLRQWLKAGTIENSQFSNTIAGTPQGGIISPVLANLTLDGLERHIEKACGVIRFKGGQKNTKGQSLRFGVDSLL